MSEATELSAVYCCSSSMSYLATGALQCLYHLNGTWSPLQAVVRSHLGHDRWTALPFRGMMFGIGKGTGELMQVYSQCPQYSVAARVPNEFSCPTFYHYYLAELGAHMLLAVTST
ncbi:hypothetical protein QYE76_005851 [Lolium multiflorum]|uniref:Uncharacterized protein n=1 Tax=Lolium multiflorum TaxID=4521 RepID=A0AAD8RTI9_LOLMU|nr:hypothetical protein QYE76_005851 [Lolium multiflorum]